MNYIMGESPTILGGNSMARELTSYGLGVTQYVVGVGASLALLVIPVEKEISIAFKLFSGSSLEIFGVATGATVANGAVTAGTGYMVGANEIVNIAGCPRFQFVATGATAIIHAMIGLSQPG